MAVEIRNETSVPLLWDHDGLDHGDWTAPWFPPRTIAPGTTGEFRAEGAAALDIATTGTEGRAWYNVGGDHNQQLYIHWDSPLIESQYDNTFHVWAPQNFEAATSGGQGHHARLIIRFRESAYRRVPGFMPSVCGFPFSNSWNNDLPVMTVGYLWNRLLDALGSDIAELLKIVRVDDNWLPLTHADAGLCGGMVFAAMDYAAAHQVPPARGTSPTDAHDPLYGYIRDRLLDSFDIAGSGFRWLAYSSPTYPNGDEGFVQTVGLARGRSWISYRDEWPKIRDDIDRGTLSPVGLIQTDSLEIGDNHQVLAYAYQQRGQDVSLWVYDPNAPGRDDVVLKFNITDTVGEVHVQREVGGIPEAPHRIFAFLRTDGYNPHAPTGGRSGDAISLRAALHRVTGKRDGDLPHGVGAAAIPSVRTWMQGI